MNRKSQPTSGIVAQRVLEHIIELRGNCLVLSIDSDYRVVKLAVATAIETERRTASARLAKERKAKREALKKYGSHLWGCASARGAEYDCDCGFFKLKTTTR